MITSLPNANVADAIGRLPSVSLNGTRAKYVELAVDSLRLTNVTINGVHIPSVSGSNENFGRQIKLDAFPSDLVGSIELFKTTSPDQDGDALAGSVNLVTKAAGTAEYFSLGVLGGIADIQGGRYNYGVDGTYSKRFGPEKGSAWLGGTYD